MLWDSDWSGSETAQVSGCDPASEYRLWRYVQAMTSTGTTAAYATGVAGIGVQIAWVNSFSQSPVFGAPPSRLVTWPGTSASLEQATQFNVPSRFRLRLVKTGAIGVGRIDLGSPIAHALYGAAVVGELRIAGQTQVQVSACTTPDVMVPLGEHSVRALPQAGSTTPPVRFDIALLDCPPGMGGISYMLTSWEAQAQTGVIAPRSPDSTTTGVGILISEPDGTPVPLTVLLSRLTRPGGEPVSDVGVGGDFEVPMQAALYRLDSTPVTPGQLHGEAEFRIWYE